MPRVVGTDRDEVSSIDCLVWTPTTVAVSFRRWTLGSRKWGQGGGQRRFEDDMMRHWSEGKFIHESSLGPDFWISVNLTQISWQESLCFPGEGKRDFGA